MGTTTLHGIPYPEATDDPYVHLDLKRQAEAVDEELPVYSNIQPPHKQGRLWVNGAVVSVSDGTRWNTMAETAFGTTGHPAMAAGWTNLGGSYGSVGYSQLMGVVYLHGAAVPAGGIPTPPNTIVTLPVGFRPASARRFLCAKGGGTAYDGDPVAIEVLTTGVVRVMSVIENGANVSLNNVVFRATA
jgi:hypothetical protein